MEKQTRKTAIYFSTALKHDKDGNKIDIFNILNEYKGTHEIYAITHLIGTDKEHTHFFIKCGTPRTIENIASIFNVDTNMIKYVYSPRAQLRYLIHLDDKDKEQYDYSEVFTNSNISYIERVGKYEITKKQILNEILFTTNLYETINKYIEIIEPNELYSMIKICDTIKKSKNFWKS